ncbi:cupin domain-containing protein [Pseudonocardia sp. HH130630-07]|uniref:cupin domain-containing protein n=1 Tax=Pseudonocardia sp. HH130630-07 TaxID=1690815 RepID=UPI000814CA0B|nr:cupin domain-containing protein [Pseudonocardia sp. HH130630-07]ANY06702.1 hypothetical protein AFB00_10810 [Pseudonocardia sp. HH130630-07]
MRSRPSTGVVLLVLAGGLLAGCAQPGQLGHEPGAGPAGAGAQAPPEPGAGPAGPAQPGVPAVPLAQAGSDARGELQRPVDISTPGPAELLIRTEVLAPGQATGWVRHPGTVVSAVRSGTLTVQRAGRCEPQDFGSGEAFFLGDGEPNELRNDGREPVVLTRSELLAPGEPEREPTDSRC